MDDLEHGEDVKAIASFVVFMDDAKGYPFISSSNNSDAVSEILRLVETRRNQMCKSFSTELEKAHSITVTT